MRTQYNLSCIEWNGKHVKFNVFDTTGANCGLLTVDALDVIHFVSKSWSGDIAWNGLIPQDVLKDDDRWNNFRAIDMDEILENDINEVEEGRQMTAEEKLDLAIATVKVGNYSPKYRQIVANAYSNALYNNENQVLHLLHVIAELLDEKYCVKELCK